MNIEKLAKQVGYPIRHEEWRKATEEFAALVAAQEREECAKLCIQMANRCDDIRKAALETAAENIMARGTT